MDSPSSLSPSSLQQLLSFLSDFILLHPSATAQCSPPSIFHSSFPAFALLPCCRITDRSKEAMAFQGTTQKCTACQKTVYLVDKLAADNRIYHKACFRCHHCKGTLKLGNYNSFEGVLYCRPHYDQLFKRTGSLDKSFEGTPKIVKPEKPIHNENASKVSGAFVGTREKCFGCKKTVYPIERVTVNGTAYHKSCFKCTHGGCTISPSNYIAHEGRLYCKHHHIQLIKEKGNLSQLETEKTVTEPAIEA